MIPRRARAALVAAALLALLATPARAHDQLIESDPAAGQTLETSPAALTLTFSADILDLSSQVVVTDAAGQVVLDAPGAIDGTVLTVEIEHPFDAGEYLVTWRVVSSDGHPIDGTFSFTVLAAAPSDPEPSPDATPEPTPDATSSADPDPTEDPADTTGPALPDVRPGGSLFATSSLWPFVLMGVLMLAAGAYYTWKNNRDDRRG